MRHTRQLQTIKILWRFPLSRQQVSRCTRLWRHHLCRHANIPNPACGDELGGFLSFDVQPHQFCRVFNVLVKHLARLFPLITLYRLLFFQTGKLRTTQLTQGPKYRAAAKAKPQGDFIACQPFLAQRKNTAKIMFRQLASAMLRGGSFCPQVPRSRPVGIDASIFWRFAG